MRVFVLEREKGTQRCTPFSGPWDEGLGQRRDGI